MHCSWSRTSAGSRPRAATTNDGPVWWSPSTRRAWYTEPNGSTRTTYDDAVRRLHELGNGRPDVISVPEIAEHRDACVRGQTGRACDRRRRDRGPRRAPGRDADPLRVGRRVRNRRVRRHRDERTRTHRDGHGLRRRRPRRGAGRARRALHRGRGRGARVHDPPPQRLPARERGAELDCARGATRG